jgi:hypothetical protein
MAFYWKLCTIDEIPIKTWELVVLMDKLNTASAGTTPDCRPI